MARLALLLTALVLVLGTQTAGAQSTGVTLQCSGIITVLAGQQTGIGGGSDCVGKVSVVATVNAKSDVHVWVRTARVVHYNGQVRIHLSAPVIHDVDVAYVAFVTG
jgi:hypothetical protein